MSDFGKPGGRSAADYFPPRRNLDALRKAAAHCQGCDLYLHATQTVFGEGRTHAASMLVGEIPGDQEDLQGRPFVGPAGKLLNEVLREAGIDRDSVYVTNVVKHFKFEQRGKRRLHKKPGLREVAACRPWLEAEIEVVAPQMLVCLGATAAQALLGRDFRLTRQRGEPTITQWAPCTVATYHPSAVLRAPDKAQRDLLRAQLVDDLRRALEFLAASRQV